jgi:hypothetical protein
MKLIKVILEQRKILIPRRSEQERQNNYTILLKKQIQQYIEDGSEGDLIYQIPQFNPFPIT